MKFAAADRPRGGRQPADGPADAHREEITDENGGQSDHADERQRLPVQFGDAGVALRLIEAPLVFLKSYKEDQAAPPFEPNFSESLLTDLEILSATARRAHRRLRAGVLRNLPDPDRQDLARCLRQSLHEIQRMAERFEREMGDAGPEHPSRDSEAAPAGA